jgi:hypothetical protein
MGTKKEDGKAWMRVDEVERARLNLYKAMIGVADNSVTDQTASLRALLDAAGVPSVPMAGRTQPEAVAQ